MSKNRILPEVFFVFLLLAELSIQASLAKPTEANQSFQSKWAIIIGVGDFREKSWNIKYARKDALDFRAYLVNHANFARSHIKMLTGKSATINSIGENLDGWLSAKPGANDLVLIYFRTRGTLPELDTRLRTYLAASDTDISALPTTAIEMDNLPLRVLQRTHAASTILIVDSDFCGGMARSKSLRFMSLPDKKLLPADHKFQVICAAASNEVNWESNQHKNSIFAYQLLSELKQQGTSAVLPEAANLISQRVMDEARNSHGRTQCVVTMAMRKGTGDVAVEIATRPECRSKR